MTAAMDDLDRLAEHGKNKSSKGKAKQRKANGHSYAEENAISGSEVLSSVQKFLGRFVAYPSEHAQIAHTLWIVHTHLMDVWESTPRIAFLSPEPASGKTRALEITELLVPSPVEAVNVTPAYLFRKVGGDDGPPTILFDEIDTVFGPKAKDNEEIRGLLNAGHRRGAVAGRCVVRGKNVMTEEIPAYCALALAGLGWLPDTLMSRSIIVRMRRRAPSEKVEPYRRRVHAAAGAKLQDRVVAWAASIAEQLNDVWPELPEGITDRDADIWEPLLAIADAAGGEWPRLSREAALALVSASKEREPSLGIRLLIDLRTIFGEQDTMSTADILADLQALKEAPWGDLKGKPLNDRGLANRLRQYDVRSKQIRLGDRTVKGYARADLHEAWLRYLSSDAKSETSETSQTSAAERASDVSDVSAASMAAETSEFNEGEIVSPVSDVSHSAASGSASRLCEQCGSPADDREPLTAHQDGARLVWLHATCARFWSLRHHSEATV